MKIKEITLSASRTINLGNYESMQVQGRCTIEFDEMDTLEDDKTVLAEAHEKAVKEIKIQMSELYNEIKPK